LLAITRKKWSECDQKGDDQFGNHLEMTWSLQQKAKCLLAEKMSFFCHGRDEMVVKKTGQVVSRSQKQVVMHFGCGHDQLGPEKLVVQFWSGATEIFQSPGTETASPTQNCHVA